MKIYKQVEQKTEEWLELRKGKVTATFLKKIVGTPKAREQAHYELLAERLSTAGVETETPLERGVRLEGAAVDEFEKRSGKLVERVGFVESGFSKWAGYSPDGLIRKGKKYAEDVEVKCLSSANHVRAWLTGKVPEEYVPQIVQGFVVNDDLKTRHVVFYDPRIEAKPYVCIKVERAEMADTIKEYKRAQVEFLEGVEDALSKIVKI